jgi:hypothetical protein
LVGAFFSSHTENYNATLGILPAFLPDFGPHFYVNNNLFTSQNPWFHPPSSQFSLSSGTGDIHYNLVSPNPQSVVEHPGAAGKFEFKNKGYLARLSAAYKPLPSFLLGFPSTNQDVLGTGGDFMNISVVPRVAYDRLVNLDNEYTEGSWKFSGSVAYDNPDDNNGPTDWTTQQVRAAEIFSGSVEQRIGDVGPKSASWRIGFLKVNGGDAADRGLFASSETLFTRRFQYYEAYLIGIRKDFLLLSPYPISTDLRVLYDRMQGGGVVSLSTGTEIGHGWRAELEADFLGLLTSTAPITDGFLSTYRANDRVGMGVGYVF